MIKIKHVTYHKNPLDDISLDDGLDRHEVVCPKCMLIIKTKSKVYFQCRKCKRYRYVRRCLKDNYSITYEVDPLTRKKFIVKLVLK